MRNFFVRHREFFGNVAILMSGRMVAALIALFMVPIVARLFSPSDFGIAAMFVSIVGILSNVSTLRYEAALALPREDTEAIAIMALAYRVLFLVCAVLTLFLGIYNVSGVTWPASTLLGDWKWALPVGVLLLAALNIQESWLTRTKSFKIASASFVVGNTVTSGARIGFGALLGSSVYGLVGGYLLGLVSRLILQRSASKVGFRAAFGHVAWPALRQVARRYADFPKFNAPADFVFSIGRNLPVLLLGVMFSPTVAGFYAMAHRLSQVPITIVATSLRRVFLQKTAAIKNHGRSLRKAFLLSTAALALLGSIPFGVLWLFGQPILTWLLGERWFVAGRYLEIMAPWLFTIWVTAPCNPIFIVLREQRFFLYRHATLTALRLGAFGLSYVLTADPEWTLRAFVIVTVATNVITILTALALVTETPHAFLAVFRRRARTEES